MTQLSFDGDNPDVQMFRENAQRLGMRDTDYLTLVMDVILNLGPTDRDSWGILGEVRRGRAQVAS